MRGINAEEHQLLKEQKLNLVPLGESFVESRTVRGLIVPVPNGEQKLMQVTPMSGRVFNLWREQLHCDRIFHITGQMTFVPDMDTYIEFERVEGQGLQKRM